MHWSWECIKCDESRNRSLVKFLCRIFLTDFNHILTFQLGCSIEIHLVAKSYTHKQ